GLLRSRLPPQARGHDLRPRVRRRIVTHPDYFLPIGATEAGGATAGAAGAIAAAPGAGAAVPNVPDMGLLPPIAAPPPPKPPGRPTWPKLLFTGAWPGIGPGPSHGCVGRPAQAGGLWCQPRPWWCHRGGT